MIAPPRQLVLEVSSNCQLACPQCFIGLNQTGRHGFFPVDLFHKVADEAQHFIKHAYLHLWGEPTLNKNLPEMIHRVHEFATIDIATHGLSITDDMAEALALCEVVCVSIDGTDQATYEQYRVGGQLSKALEGLKKLIEVCKPEHLRWLYVVFKENEHEIGMARRMAEKLGVRIEFKSAAFWDRSKMDCSMPSEDKYRRFIKVDGEWQLKADRLKCREFWETIYVLPNGDVITCCYDGRAQYIMGNVLQDSILDIWNGEKYNAMRERHSGGTLNEMCSNCQMMAVA
jgi:radical SAM protein with 4Fe4S-binding SPASM domain